MNEQDSNGKIMKWAVILTAIVAIFWIIYRLFIVNDNQPILVFSTGEEIPTSLQLARYWDLLLLPLASFFLYTHNHLKKKHADKGIMPRASLSREERSTAMICALIWGGLTFFSAYYLTNHLNVSLVFCAIGIVIGQYARWKFPLSQTATIIVWGVCLIGPFVGLAETLRMTLLAIALLVAIYVLTSLAEIFSRKLGKFWVN